MMKAPHLFAALSLVAASLGIAPTAHATVPEGTLSFVLPSDAPSTASPPADASVVPTPPELTPESASASDPESAAAVVPPPPASDRPAASPSPPPGSILNFDASSAPSTPPSRVPPSPRRPLPASPPPAENSDLFSGGSNSLVARTVGHAEGTRTPDGSKTRAYQGHADPGNGVWNLGSFSFQHCREAQYNCATPEQADQHQLRRLEAQAAQLRRRAQELGLEMTLAEELNGIDLANQAPLAALGKPGYPEWLKQAREKGMTDADAILWARVSSYWDPQLRSWNAPGLGNREGTITHDQNRRMQAIARALDIYAQQVAAGKIVSQRVAKADTQSSEDQMADRIIWQDLASRSN